MHGDLSADGVTRWSDAAHSDDLFLDSEVATHFDKESWMSPTGVGPARRGGALTGRYYLGKIVLVAEKASGSTYGVLYADGEFHELDRQQAFNGTHAAHGDEARKKLEQKFYEKDQSEMLRLQEAAEKDDLRVQFNASLQAKQLKTKAHQELVNKRQRIQAQEAESSHDLATATQAHIALEKKYSAM